MRRLLRTFKHPSSVLLASTSISLPVGLLSAAIQARVLGPDGRGELAMAMVPGALIAMLLCLGLPDYFARRAAKGTSLRDLSKLAGLFSLAIGAAAVLPYLILLQFIAPIGSEASQLLVIYALTVPLSVYGYCLNALAIGAGRWTAIFLVRVVPLLVGVGVLIAIVISPLSDPTPFVFGVVLIAVSALGSLFLLFRAELRPGGSVIVSDVRQALWFGLRGWTAGSVALLNQRIDLLLMTAMASNAALGLYVVSTTLAAILNTVANAFAMPVRNKVAQGDVAIVARSSAFAMLVVSALGVVVVAILPWLVRVVLGEEFLSAIPIMVVLIAAQVPLAGVVVLSQSLIGAGHPGAPFGGEVIACIVKITLILALFSTQGVIAAAIAAGIGNLVSLAFLLHLARRHIARAPLWRYFVILPPELITMVANQGKRS